MELDLFRRSDGTAGIVDQQEFDELAATGLLMRSQIDNAVVTAKRLLPLVESRTEPFGDAARPWLRRLRLPEE